MDKEYFNLVGEQMKFIINSVSGKKEEAELPRDEREEEEYQDRKDEQRMESQRASDREY